MQSLTLISLKKLYDERLSPEEQKSFQNMICETSVESEITKILCNPMFVFKINSGTCEFATRIEFHSGLKWNDLLAAVQSKTMFTLTSSACPLQDSAIEVTSESVIFRRGWESITVGHEDCLNAVKYIADNIESAIETYKNTHSCSCARFSDSDSWSSSDSDSSIE